MALFSRHFLVKENGREVQHFRRSPENGTFLPSLVEDDGR